ncbi:hypothetical protein J4443_01605 [Candidatus Woesearchaeota archaeon]|nr:hypothetical protein [Candidatus Woesearchaeota archaeon]
MKTITYVNQKSLANILGLFGFFSGLVSGIIFSLTSSIAESMMGIPLATGLGVLTIVFSPIAYGAVGYVSGYIGASIYNKIIVPKMGGIEIELE